MSRRPIIALAAIVSALVALALLVAVAAAVTPAQMPALDGTWSSNVSLQNPPPGVDATFQALDTFTAGGGVVVSSSQAHPAARSLAQGTCSQGGARTYACTFVWFRFDPATGASVGMQRVERAMSLAADDQSFTATDTIDILAPNGSVVATLHGTESAHRLAS